MPYTDGSYTEARRLASQSWNGIGPDTYRAEMADAANEMASGLADQQMRQMGADNYANAVKGYQLQQMGLDQQSQINQQNILAQEQARRNRETQAKYAYLRQQANNQLAGQKAMTQSIQGMFGSGQGMLAGLLNSSGSSPNSTPTTSIYGDAGTPIGGTSYRGGALSGLVRPGKPPVFG